VSGYLESGPVEGHELVGAAASHAWLAVRLPDGSWLDLDPTNDLVDPTHHVTVAYGRDYRDVLPLGGVIFANALGSTLDVAVVVRRVEGPADLGSPRPAGPRRPSFPDR
jgi:transglutaminase-like putative cysteine protease